MDNVIDVTHCKDYYKGKSIDFAGIWTPGARYFNDEFLTNFVVYNEKDSTGAIIRSALLACKQTHLAKMDSSIPNSTNNQPHLIWDDKLGVIGIEPNDYWIYVCGSIRGVSAESAIIVEDYAEAILQATSNNLGRVVYIKDTKSTYIVIGEGRLQRIVVGDELQSLADTKVDKVDGMGLSEENFTSEEKAKLETIEENAQKNVIENILFNGVKLAVIDKSVNIEFKKDTYTIDKLSTPEGDYFASYVFKMNGLRTGATINIPKDTAISSGSVEDVVRNGYPYAGARVGDKFIDIVLNDTSKTHVYIPAGKLVDIYTGDKYITVNEGKNISLNYDTLKSDLSSSIKIGISQVDTLKDRLETLEKPDAKVISIGTATTRLGGEVFLNPKDFLVDNKEKSISINTLNFDTAGVADRVHDELLGKVSDVLSLDSNTTEGLSLYGIKNTLIDFNGKHLTKDNIGKGLLWSEDDSKIIFHEKKDGPIRVNSNGEVELVWN